MGMIISMLVQTLSTGHLLLPQVLSFSASKLQRPMRTGQEVTLCAPKILICDIAYGIVLAGCSSPSKQRLKPCFPHRHGEST